MDSQSVESKKHSKKIEVLLVIFIFILIGGFVYVRFFEGEIGKFFVKNQVSEEKPGEQQENSKDERFVRRVETKVVENWELPASNKRGFAFLQGGDGSYPKTYLYLFDDGALHVIEPKADFGGAGVYVGYHEPVTSPDFRYTAHFNVRGDVILTAHQWLISKEVLKATAEEEYYIFGWSPDSKKLILTQLDAGYGDMGFIKKAYAAEIGDDFSHTYIIFDTETGKLEKIESSGGFANFIDNHTILQFQKSGQPVAIDLNTLEVNSEVMNKLHLIDFSGDYAAVTPYRFSADGTKVAYDTSQGQSMNIRYADLGTQRTRTIISGDFAQYQSPVISDSGKSIAYAEERYEDNPHLPVPYTWVYDTSEGTRIELGQGRPVRWIDGEHLLIWTNPATYHIVNAYGYSEWIPISVPK